MSLPAPISRSFLLHNIEFRPEFVDFRRGIRVGNLNDNERITRILKLDLESRYRQAFVTERWGRGVYWQWIGYLVKANRTAKPISSHISFGCSKFFIMMDTEEQSFKCGLQVERGFIRAPIGLREIQAVRRLGLVPTPASAEAEGSHGTRAKTVSDAGGFLATSR